jgi:hypothetical protein
VILRKLLKVSLGFHQFSEFRKKHNKYKVNRYIKGLKKYDLWKLYGNLKVTFYLSKVSSRFQKVSEKVSVKSYFRVYKSHIYVNMCKGNLETSFFRKFETKNQG